MITPRPLPVLALAAVLVGAALLLNVVLPLAEVDDVLCVTLILLALWLPWPRACFVLAGLATALVLLDAFLLPSAAPAWVDRLDGAVTVGAVWLAAFVVSSRHALEAALRASEERGRRLALHDPLTGLPNRTLLLDRLGRALALARREGGAVALMLLDLDNFKGVNDSLGHPAGDQLLRLVAGRLGAAVRASDTLARLGGDEFAVVQAGRGATAAPALARRLADALAAPFALDDHEVQVAASVGVALSPADGDEPDELVRRADLALYRAKADGRGRCRFFEPAMDEEVRAHRRLEVELRQALERGD